MASRVGLLATVAWAIGGEVAYALEGSAFIAGAAVQWLRDGLGLIRSADGGRGAGPQRAGHRRRGLRAGARRPGRAPLAAGGARPHRAGIDRGTRAGHLARAALEGIALEVFDLADGHAAGGPRTAPRPLKVDGGACKNDLLMQLQADLLERPVVRPKMVETTALGAAFLAGLAVGFWKSRDEIGESWKMDRRFTPKMGGAARDRHARAVEVGAGAGVTA